MSPDDVRELKADVKELLNQVHGIELGMVDFNRKVGERLDRGRERFADISECLDEHAERLDSLDRLALKIVIIGSIVVFIVGPFISAVMAKLGEDFITRVAGG
jgi:hypothetical protein